MASVSRHVAWLVGGVVMLLSLSVGLVSSASLSPEQKTEDAMGAYEYTSQMPTEFPLGQAPGDVVATTLNAHGATRTTEFLTYYPGFEELDRRETPVTEGDWTSKPFGDKFELVSGQWPTSPGEVTINRQMAKELDGDTTLTAANGAIRLHVVGVFTDLYSRDSPTILASPGTWIASDVALAGDRFPSLGASLVMLWDGGNLTQQLPALADALAVTSDLSPEDMLQMLTMNTADRTTILSQFVSGVVNDPTIGVYPLIAAPLVAGLIGGLLNGRWQRKLTTQFRTLGLPTTASRLAVFSAGIINALAGAVAGVATGLLLTIIGRPLLNQVLDQALSPLAFPWRIWGLLVIVPVVGLTVVQAILLLTLRTWRMPSWAPTVRRALVLGAGIYAVIYAPTVRTSEQTALMVGLLVLAATLLAADVVRALALVGPKGDTAITLSRRLATSPGQSLSGLAAALTLLLGIISGGTIVATSQVASMTETNVASMPPGFVMMYGVNGPVTEEMRTEVEDYTGLSNHIEGRYVEIGYFMSEYGALGVVDTPEEVERLTGLTLDTDTIEALNQGAALTPGQSMEFETTDGRNITIEAIPVTWAKDFEYGALMLPAGVQALGLSINEPPTIFYPNVSADQLTMVQQAADDLGFSRDFIDWYRPADRFSLPLTSQIALGALGLVSIGVVMIFVGGLVKNLRPHLSIARAIGMPNNWIKTVVIHQILLTTGAALLLTTTLIGVFALLFRQLMNMPVVLPWTALALVLLSGALGAALGLAFALWRLTAAERDLSGAH